MPFPQPPFNSPIQTEPTIKGIVTIKAVWQNWLQLVQSFLANLTNSGPTSARPTSDLWVGQPFFDTTLKVPVWWDGSAWVTSAPGGGVTSVAATSPISSSGGTTPNISITQANATTNGYLSSADWTTFNSKLNSSLAITKNGSAFSPAATSRPVSDMLGDYVSVKDFGALGDGSHDDTTAMLNAEAASTSVYWPPGTYVLTQTPTLGISWGSGVVIVSGTQGYLHPLTGTPIQIFANVFGLPTNNSIDAGPSIQRAINFAQSKNLPLIFNPNGDYGLQTGLTANAGRTGGFTYNVDIDFNNCILRPFPSITALKINGVCAWSNTSSGDAICNITIKNALFDGYAANSSSIGLSIGTPGYQIQANTGYISNVEVANWKAGGTQALIQCVQDIEFENCIFAPRIAQANGQFTGDLQFYSCQMIPQSSTDRNIIVTAYNGSSGSYSQVRGLKFTDCNLYGANGALTASGYSQVGDIWFYGCQWDHTSDSAGSLVLSISASSSGQDAQIFNISLEDPYFVGYSGNMIFAAASSGGSIYSLRIIDLYANTDTISSTVYNSVVFLSGVSSATITNANINGISGASGSSIINIQSSSNIVVSNNIATNCSSVPYGISIGNSSNNYVITGNTMNVSSTTVNDYTTGSPTRIIRDNLGGNDSFGYVSAPGRSFNTNYTNTTNRHMYVTVWAIASGGTGSLSMWIGGTTPGTGTSLSAASVPNGQAFYVSGVCPPGMTYRIECATPGTTSVGNWVDMY